MPAFPGIATRGRDWRVLLAAAIFAALPTIGLFSGGAYAALVFLLTGVIILAGVTRNQWPSVDRPLAAISGLVLLLLWISAAWSIVPERSLAGALQMTGIFGGCLLFIGLRRPLEPAAPVIFRALLIAMIVGPALVVVDRLVGYPILEVFTGRSPEVTDIETKLARGLSQLAILVWPGFAFARLSGRPIQAAAAAVALVVLGALVASSATAAVTGLVIGAVTLALAYALPRLVAAGLAVLIALVGLAGPWIGRALEAYVAPLAADIKPSATHRLEIWDYMSARVLERPLTGWGWLSANALPIHPDELARYRWVGPGGTSHPHDFWLQLWVEVGAGGAILGCAFALFVLWRAWRQPPEARPFALAAMATAFAGSLASFNLATDAWWCAVAATGLLFTLLDGARKPAP